MKKIVFIILGVFILTGCNGFPNDTISQPEGKVIVDGERFIMIPGDYEWKEDNVEISSKTNPNINELVEPFETLDVAKGEILNFEIDENPSSVTVYKVDEEGKSEIVDVEDNEITMPSESGYYIFQLETIWPKGNQEFVFDVNVK
ncbi:membrane lipoprotein lipid attachment site-containing protein [Ureibacillus sp. FSL E2-3493]|uniref:membrane lipoprotein lipid attachment site-containing protein n=1 Tax=Ureibacillus sp. FSL E2-3493 TaxID=2921367 RepID=UPI00311A1FC2